MARNACSNCKRININDKVYCQWCGQRNDEIKAAKNPFKVKEGKVGFFARWWWVAAIVLFFIYAVSLGNDNQRPTVVQPAGPIEMMATVFIGGHSQTTIRREMRTLAIQLGVSVTDENLQKWGSVLVRLRRHLDNVTEMEILRCVIGTGQRGSFPDLAAICGTALDPQ